MQSPAPPIVSQIVARATEAGAFGPGAQFVSYTAEGLHNERDQFASTILYGKVTVRQADDDDYDKGHSIRLVLKFKLRSAEFRAMFANDKQFHNETLFYERIAPFLLDHAPADNDHRPPLCRYFYGRNDCGDRVLDDVIVLENVTDRGYRMSDERLHLDFDHLVVALRTLAKFHGLSYRAKREDPTGFADVVAGIEETQFKARFSGTGDVEWMLGDRAHVALFSAILDELEGRRGGGGDYRRRMRAEFLDDPTGTMRRALRPDEPVAVLCHGDFNRNNLLFRYDADGRPADAVPVDTATVRYGSPALDLSFFLYMNADRRTRDRHWDALLDEYCAALSAAAPGLAPVPGRARLDAEMRDRGVYGVAHVSAFVRIVTGGRRLFEPGAPVVFDDEKLRALSSLGGDRATELVADVVQHFLDRVCATAAADRPF